MADQKHDRGNEKLTKPARYLSIMCATLLTSVAGATAQETMYVAGFGGTVEATFREKIIPAFEAKFAPVRACGEVTLARPELKVEIIVCACQSTPE